MAKPQTQQLRIFDAHCHLQELDQPCTANFHRLANAGSPQEAAALSLRTQSEDGLLLSCGLHPWHCSEGSIAVLLPWMQTAAAIGEIGMDSHWCAQPLLQQERVFCEQLALAEEFKKPVVLHTKGCEREILRHLQGFSQRILVHWYSCGDYLEEYLTLDCYFTVGPDFRSNPATSRVAERVPRGRLLLESDGTDALSWALEQPVAPGEAYPLLCRALLDLEQQRGEALEEALWGNAFRFLGLALP